MVQRQQRQIKEFKATDQQGRENRFTEREHDARVKRQQEEMKKIENKQQSSNQNLTPLSSPEQKKESSEAVFEMLSEFFFNQVNFLPYPGRSTSGTITSTTNFGMLVRVPDTARGKHIRSDKKSKLRTVFYIEDGGAAHADAYILSPCAYQSTSLGTVVSLDIFNSYVGIKLYKGNLQLVSKSSGASEKTKDTNIKLSGITTYVLEIHFNVTNAEIFLDGESLGLIDVDFSGITYDMITTYPLIAPIRSATGTGVALTLENYQFIQDR